MGEKGSLIVMSQSKFDDILGSIGNVFTPSLLLRTVSQKSQGSDFKILANHIVCRCLTHALQKHYFAIESVCFVAREECVCHTFWYDLIGQ